MQAKSLKLETKFEYLSVIISSEKNYRSTSVQLNKGFTYI